MRSIDFDLKAHRIRMEVLMDQGTIAVVEFIDVIKYSLDHRSDAKDVPLEAWEVIDLSEFHYLPELRTKKHSPRLDGIDFNFLVEMYNSELLIHACHITVDGVRVS
ncbi:MAG TPA: hypothetical protein VHL57_08435 [Flavobacteriales bacterium]|jgi:hypothetical protein|nr:hypothetical protein [Flavobacteriales bacterium]